MSRLQFPVSALGRSMGVSPELAHAMGEAAIDIAGTFAEQDIPTPWVGKISLKKYLPRNIIDETDKVLEHTIPMLKHFMKDLTSNERRQFEELCNRARFIRPRRTTSLNVYKLWMEANQYRREVLIAWDYGRDLSLKSTLAKLKRENDQQSLMEAVGSTAALPENLPPGPDEAVHASGTQASFEAFVSTNPALGAIGLLRLNGPCGPALPCLIPGMDATSVKASTKDIKHYSCVFTGPALWPDDTESDMQTAGPA